MHKPDMCVVNSAVTKRGKSGLDPTTGTARLVGYCPSGTHRHVVGTTHQHETLGQGFLGSCCYVVEASAVQSSTIKSQAADDTSNKK